jgi:hypothetical protein
VRIEDWGRFRLGNPMLVHAGDSQIGMWANTCHDDVISVNILSPGVDDMVFVPVPTWVHGAWDAGEPVEPLIDWMIENALGDHPELADLFQRAAVES